MYQTASLPFVLPVSTIPSVTAGLMWHPEIGPIVKAMTRRVNPKAMAMPWVPIALPASTALPTPPSTRTEGPEPFRQHDASVHPSTSRPAVPPGGTHLHRFAAEGQRPCRGGRDAPGP